MVNLFLSIHFFIRSPSLSLVSLSHLGVSLFIFLSFQNMNHSSLQMDANAFASLKSLLILQPNHISDMTDNPFGSFLSQLLPSPTESTSSVFLSLHHKSNNNSSNNNNNNNNNTTMFSSNSIGFPDEESTLFSKRCSSSSLNNIKNSYNQNNYF